MSHRKRPLKKGWYHATIRDAREHEDRLRITWTVDRGEFAYRNVIETYGLNEEGIELLKERMLEIGYIIYEDYTDDFFFTQFTTTDFRADLHVDRTAEGQYIKNVILERRLPTKSRDYNIKKAKDETFYNKNNRGRDLPIREESKR